MTADSKKRGPLSADFENGPPKFGVGTAEKARRGVGGFRKGPPKFAVGTAENVARAGSGTAEKVVRADARCAADRRHPPSRALRKACHKASPEVNQSAPQDSSRSSSRALRKPLPGALSQLPARARLHRALPELSPKLCANFRTQGAKRTETNADLGQLRILRGRYWSVRTRSAPVPHPFRTHSAPIPQRGF